MMRVSPFWLTAIALAAGLVIGAGAGAQELEALEEDAAFSTDPFVSEAPAGTSLFGDASMPMSAYAAESGFAEEGVPAVRPVNWISGPYLRGGVNFVLDDNIFDVDQGTGYGISGGWRQPLGPEIGGDRFFLDLGGSYQEAIGEASPVLIDGLQTGTTVDVTDPDDVGAQSFSIQTNAFQTTLEELRRGSLHAALGWFWGPGLDNRSCDPQLRFATRIGGRVGHARGGYAEQRLLPPSAPTQVGNFRTTFENRPVYYQKTDTYGGLFVATEAILLQRQYSFGHFQWTVDGEFANDWINIGNVWDGSLGTASVMMGFMLSR